MAFRNNDALIVTSTEVDVIANNANDVYVATGATAFVIASGEVGDDTLLGFNNNDSILNSQKIFDGNNDGFIQFGPNGLLDIDRVSRKNAGTDQLSVGGANDAVTELRYLGTKANQFVYTDSSTLKALWTDFGGQANVMEGTVGNDAIDFSTGSKTLLVDNALGLNLGGDTLTGFGSNDLLVTTSKLYDRTGNDIVTFGNNDVLDVSGAAGPNSSDPTTGPGGQLAFVSPDHQSVHYLGSKVIGDVEYYFYGTADTTVNPFMNT